MSWCLPTTVTFQYESHKWWPLAQARPLGRIWKEEVKGWHHWDVKASPAWLWWHSLPSRSPFHKFLQQPNPAHHGYWARQAKADRGLYLLPRTFFLPQPEWLVWRTLTRHSEEQTPVPLVWRQSPSPSWASLPSDVRLEGQPASFQPWFTFWVPCQSELFLHLKLIRCHRCKQF